MSNLLHTHTQGRPPHHKKGGEKQREERGREPRGEQTADTWGTPEPRGAGNAVPAAPTRARSPLLPSSPYPTCPPPSQDPPSPTPAPRNTATDRQDEPPRIAQRKPRRTPRTAQPQAAHPVQPAAHPSEAWHTGGMYQDPGLTDRWNTMPRRYAAVRPWMLHANPATGAAHSSQTRSHGGTHQRDTSKDPPSAVTHPPRPQHPLPTDDLQRANTKPGPKPPHLHGEDTSQPQTATPHPRAPQRVIITPVTPQHTGPRTPQTRRPVPGAHTAL